MTGPAAIQAVQGRIGEILARLGGVAPASDALVLGGVERAGAAGPRTFAAELALAGAAGAQQPTLPGAAAGAGDAVVDAASAYLGVPYRWGGTDPATGLDCSGLVQRAFADLGVAVPRTAAEQARVGEEVPSLAAARPGDLLVWLGSPNHVGIYLGDGRMLHAPRTGDVVKVADVRREAPDTIRRVPVPGAAAPAGAEALSPATWSSVAGAATAMPGGGAAGATPYSSLFAAAERRYALPDGLLAAVARRESAFDADAVSPAGALGLMQLMPGTAAELGVDPLDPSQAVDGAARYLRRQVDDFGSLRLALAAYNAGPGAVREHGGVPPYRETRDYVAAVTAGLPGGAR